MTNLKFITRSGSQGVVLGTEEINQVFKANLKNALIYIYKQLKRPQRLGPFILQQFSLKWVDLIPFDKARKNGGWARSLYRWKGNA